MTLAMVLNFVLALCVIITVLVLLATALVRLPFLAKYSDPVNKFGNTWFKVLASLPTFGVNPNTKKLQDAYNELRAENNLLKNK